MWACATSLAMIAHSTHLPSGRGEASRAAVPHRSDRQLPAPSSDLGANEWLVDEMREQYAADPGSVTPEWAAYFGGQRQRRHAPGRATSAAEDRPGAGRRPARSRAAPAAPQAAGEGPRAPATGSRPRHPPPLLLTGQAAPHRRCRRARHGHHQAAGQGRQAGRTGRGERRADVHRRCAARRRGRQEHERLAGAVPTATSVRAVPGEAAVRQPHRHQQPPRSAPAAARSPSRTSSATRWCRPSRPCRR